MSVYSIRDLGGVELSEMRIPSEALAMTWDGRVFVRRQGYCIFDETEIWAEDLIHRARPCDFIRRRSP